MTSITVTAQAFEALAATLALGSVGYVHEHTMDGGYHVWLDARTVSNLDALRWPGEDYSPAIIRLVAMGRAGEGDRHGFSRLTALKVAYRAAHRNRELFYALDYRTSGWRG